MQKNWLTIGLSLLLAVSLIIGFTYRKPVPLPKQQALSTYSFEYYPKANIYYNLTDSEYYYQDDSGSWQTAKTLPAFLSRNLDRKVVLKGQTKNIWKNNDIHRMQYAVQLYAKAEDLNRDSTEMAPPPPPARPQEAVAPATDNQPKEKGLKRFFSKLFKKKSKENQ